MAAPATAHQRIAQIVGIVLILAGIIGFFNDPLLGAFDVDVVHNLVHLITGIIFAWVGFAGSHGGSVASFKTFGIIYLIVALLGFFAHDALNAIMATDGAGHVLHLIFAIIFLIFGFAWMGDRGPAARRA